jgi:hypothetical protein
MLTKIALIAFAKGVVVALWGLTGHWLEQRRQKQQMRR